MAFKTIFVTFMCLIFASCAAKGPTQINQKTFGDETLKLVRNGLYTLGCNDAKYMADVFSSDNYTVISFTTRLAMDYMTNKNISASDQKKLDNYAKLLDVLTHKLEAKYKNDPKAMDMIMKKIFNNEINHMMEGAIAAYLGMATSKNFYEFVDITYCGGKPSAGYKSPIGISSENLRNALMKKFDGLTIGKDKAAPKNNKSKTKNK